MLFPWKWSLRKLHDEFYLIQDQAGIKRRDGQRYGFHDLRRGFATMNADRMTAEALQRIMATRATRLRRDTSIPADSIRPASENIFVPQLPVRKGGGA